MRERYIHGSSDDEQGRLDLMNRLINESYLDALELAGERRVLDLGCGTGQFTRAIAHALGAKARVIGVERDARQLKAARDLAALANDTPNVEFLAGDASNPPGGRDAFDLVHARFLLEHVRDPLGVVNAMVSSARPGGRIVVADDDHPLMRFSPELPSVRAVWRAYYELYTRRGQDPRVGRHLTGLLDRAGATPVRIDQVFYGACHGSVAFAGLVENLARVLDGAREAVIAEGLTGAAEYSAALEELRHFAGQRGAALWYAINLAEGLKPARA